MNVEEEVERLREEIKRLGKVQDDGSYKYNTRNIGIVTEAIVFFWNNNVDMGSLVTSQVTFGVLFNDDRCANIFEALVGTLRAAKKRKFLTYEGELLLQGVHDNVEIILKPTAAATTEASAAVGKS